jgi:signal transduction histidine kinase
MKKRIFIRSFLMTSGIVFLSFVILGSMLFLWSYNLVMREKLDAMKSTGKEVARFISYYSIDYDLDDFEMRAILTTFSRTSDFDILIADPYGTVISSSDSGYNSAYIGKKVPGTILTQVNTRPPYIDLSNLDGIYSDTRYVFGARLTPGSNPGIIGYIFLSSQATDMAQLWRQFAALFMIVAVAVLILIFIITYFTARKQSKPLNEMANAARRFARGDFTVRVDDNEERVDEIGQLMEAFNSMADALERSEKLRRDFIANVSHELKTPMTVISGFSDGILDGTIPKASERQYLEIISSETKRLSRLVRKMLELSRLQPVTAEELVHSSFDISEVIRLSLLSFESKIEGKGLDVETELPEEAVLVRGDEDAIRQVVYNLIDNAVKFAEKGTALRLSVWKQGQRVFVSVENTGETIPSSEMPLIFDRFHKSDRSRSADKDGVGLGLYIVKTILDSHNEDIFVTSSRGVTKFTFTLTLANY